MKEYIEKNNDLKTYLNALEKYLEDKTEKGYEKKISFDGLEYEIEFEKFYSKTIISFGKENREIIVLGTTQGSETNNNDFMDSSEAIEIIKAIFDNYKGFKKAFIALFEGGEDDEKK